MIYYFAYGSNLRHKLMLEKCSDSQYLRRVKLDGYKFQYDGYSKSRNGAVGNVVESESDIVWGGLWEISENDLKKLDRQEGYFTRIYDRKEVDVFDNDGEKYIAMTYFRTGKKTGKPSRDYVDMILDGARECGLPEEHVNLYLNINCE